MAAVADLPIGVDLEWVKSRQRALWHVVASETERTRIRAAVPDGTDALHLTIVWTLKEAVLKAEGVGLSRLPRGLVVEVCRAERRCLTSRLRDTVTGRSWQGRTEFGPSSTLVASAVLWESESNDIPAFSWA